MKKNLLMKKILFSLIAMTFAFAVKGQDIADPKNGFLRGRLLNSLTKEPLLFSTVALLKASDSTLIGGVTADEEGRFIIEKLSYGNYLLKVSNVGFHPYISHPIELKKGDNRLDLGTFFINPSTTELTEVVIEAARPLLEQQAGKLVFNVSESTTSVGDNALETLKKFPGVMVDNEDNISLNGKSGVQVMLDNRPTYLSGTQLASLLKSLPSSSIEKIEAIDNPSAKYDAEGVSGILNIKTKRTRMMGYSGSAFAGTRYNDQFSKDGGFDLNFRSNKITTYANFNYFEQSSKSGSTGQIDYPDGSRWEENEKDGENYLQKHKGRYLFGKAGLDYYMNSRNILSLSYQVSEGKGSNGGDVRTRMYSPGSDIVDSSYSQGYDSEYTYGDHNVSLNYQHIFDSAKQRQFFVDANWIRNYQDLEGVNGIQHYTGDFAGNPANEKYNLMQPLSSDIFSIKSDLEFPFDNAKKTKLDAGLKYSYVKNDNNQEYRTSGVINPDYTNHYEYEENISAFYAMINHTFSEKLSVQAGLRGEYTALEGYNLTMDSTHTNDYFRLFPTLNLNSQITKKSGLNLSYRYRLTRPRYTDLNPIVARNSAYGWTSGNPYLNPEYSHMLSLRYSLNHMPIATLSYERSDGNIHRISYYDDDGITMLNRPENIGKSTRLGLNLMTQQFFFNKWQFMLYLDASYFWSEYTYNGKLEKTENYSGNAYIYNGFTLTPTMSLELSSWASLPGKTLFTENKGMFAVNLGLKKSFFKKSLTATLSVNDIFNTSSVYTMDVRYPTGQRSYSEYYWQGRSISLRLSYRFGKGNVQTRQMRNASEEEAQRGGSGQQGGGQQGGGMGR